MLRKRAMPRLWIQREVAPHIWTCPDSVDSLRLRRLIASRFCRLVVNLDLVAEIKL